MKSKINSTDALKKILFLIILVAIIFFQKAIFSPIAEVKIQQDQNQFTLETYNNRDQLPWSKGTMGNAEKNLIQHFQKHGEEVGVGSQEDYYHMANYALNPQSGFIKILRTDGKIDYFNPINHLLVGLSTSGDISTFHKVVHPAKLQRLLHESGN